MEEEVVEVVVGGLVVVRGGVVVVYGGRVVELGGVLEVEVDGTIDEDELGGTWPHGSRD
jgi:hypothetical protein